MKPTLVVLAAGIGNRYGGLKQMDSIGPSGETIVDYSIYDAARAGLRPDRLCHSQEHRVGVPGRFFR